MRDRADDGDRPANDGYRGEHEPDREQHPVPPPRPALVDGLGQLRIFFHIKLPLVLPTIGLVSVLTFVGNFNAFDLIYSVKGALAGPNFASDILGTFFYRTFFGNQLQLGNPTMGAAVATVMFFIILVGVCLYLFLVQRRIRRYAL